jgi:ribosomal-protein-alanine N-acetyltransferase
VNAPETIDTERLSLRRPRLDDADAIFARYASDPDVTRHVGWPVHRSVDDTRAFLEFAHGEWERWGTGAYLIVRREDGALLGSTGLSCETPHRAMTGYVLAPDAWGRGYATESLRAMVDLARRCGIRRLYALCHTGHPASARVLEKCGFTREGTWRRHTEFPNLAPGEPLDVFCYVRTF